MQGLVRSAAVLLLALAPLAGFAQGQFPTRPLTITVGYPPGGGPDATARAVARKLAENIGQAVVVENKPGAGGNLAVQHIAAAPPDGYTIHLGAVGALTIAPVMPPGVSYDVRKDLAPLTMAATLPSLIVVHPQFAARTMPEFIALAKRKRGDLTYGSTGVGTSAHLAMEFLMQRAHIDLLHVPYKGAGAAMPDVLAGRVSAFTATIAALKPHVDTGKLVALATTGATRSAQMPDTPTVAELLPGYEVTTWYGFVAPARVPREILDYWNRELVRVLKDPGVAAELSRQGMEPAPGTREDFARYIAAELDKWAKLVRDAKIKAD
jgi:tripartite-type tricarboxylate transporter receptor subunit TctC